jgi:Ca2+-binding RTX toxin-like protein
MEENVALSQDERKDFSAGVFYVSGLGKDTLIGTLSDDTLQGNENNDELYGNQGDDVLNGNQDDDQVYGGEGDDAINGGARNDILYGDSRNNDTDTDPLTTGFGNDVISGDKGDDWIYGNQGDDQLDGGDGEDRIWGGQGNDFLSGGNGNDELNGDLGEDIIVGGNGNDTGNGGDGNDQVFGEEGNDFLIGGKGSDLIDGGTGNDQILGDDPSLPFGFGNNNDIILAGDGDDIVLAGFGDDQVFGNAGNDIIDAQDGNDLIYGGQGNDTASGGGGDDRMFGDKGNDVLIAGTGDDEVSCGEGNDYITGNEGNDELNGNEGDDTVYGGQGNDVVRGGAGKDLVFGDKGNDTLILDPGDTVTGGEGDDLFRLIRGNGAFNPAEAANISDFRASGIDFLELAGDLKFEDLNIFDGIGENAGKAIVQDKLTGQTLAVLNGITAADLNRDKFLPVAQPQAPASQENQELQPSIPVTSGPGAVTPPQPVQQEPAVISFSLGEFILNENGEHIGSPITVKRTGSLTQELSVDVVLATDVTATRKSTVAQGQPFDFDDTVFPITLTFAADESEQKVVIPLVDDDLDEPAETIELALTNLQGENAELGDKTTIVKIQDNDDPGNLEFAAAEYIVGENKGSIDIQVRRNGGTNGKVSVNLILDAAATPTAGTKFAFAGTDYTNIFGSSGLRVDFANGESVKTVSIPILDDTPPTPDGTKEIKLTLANPDPPTAQFDPIQKSTVRILDDDIPTLTISKIDDQADEGDPSNTAIFEISSSLGDQQLTQVVNLQIGGTAKIGADDPAKPPQPPSDYIISGITDPAKPAVTISGGTTKFTVSVPQQPNNGLNDKDTEGPETIIIDLLPAANPTDYNIGADKSTTINLLDDDKPTVSLEATGQIAENNLAQAVDLTFTLKGAIPAPITVSYTVGGSAKSGSDYTINASSVTFNPGDVDPLTNTATKKVKVSPLDDDTREPNEIISISLTKPSGDEYALDPEKNKATVTVLDDEKSLLIFTPSDPLALEAGNASDITGEFKISRFGGSANPVTVNYKIDTTVANSATPGVDYDVSSLSNFNAASLTGSVVIPVGQESVSLSIKPINDGISNEPLTEFVKFVLLPPGVSGVGYEDPKEAEATIQLINNGG